MRSIRGAAARGAAALVWLSVLAGFQISSGVVRAEVATLAIGEVEAAHGDGVEVPVELTGAAAIGAVHLEITFDPEVLTPTDVVGGSMASSALVDFNATDGRVVIGVVSSDGIDGNGSVVIARFDVIGSDGATSPLALENVQAWEATIDRFELKIDTTDGTFTVNNGGGLPWWLFAAIAAAVLMLVVLVMVWRRRHRRASVPATPPVAPAPTGPPVPPMGGHVPPPPPPPPMAPPPPPPTR